MHDHASDHAPTESPWSAAFWDERYGSSDRIWSGHPNPQLVREAADLEPSTALDAGCGEGADAHWLARRGWRVTALDISAVALARGAAHAEPEIAERIEWRQVDLLEWVPDGRTYDLVSAQFVHVPMASRDRLVASLAAAVAAGGTLLVVGHHPSDLDTTMGRPNLPELLFTAEQVAAALDPDRWDVLVAEARPRPAVDPEGRKITIADAVLRARRSR
jgi:SAM-dependent methyltransferase